MNFKVQSSGLVGEPNDWDWSQFYEFKPDDEILAKNMGEMFVVASLETARKGDDLKREDLITTGKDLTSSLKQRYFVSSGNNTLENLKAIVNSVIHEYPKSLNVKLSVVVKKEDVVFLVCYGGAGISIFRRGVLTSLLKGRNGVSASASGHIKKNDVLLLYTDLFFEEFGGGRLKAALGSEDIKGVAERFTPMIHAKESSGGLAVLFLDFDEDLMQQKPSEVQENYIKVYPPKPHLSFKSKLGGLLKKTLYVKEEDVEFTKRRKVSASVGVLLLFLLIVSIFFGVKQKKQRDFKKSYEQVLISAKHSLEESENLLSLDPERSRELFLDARGKVLGLSSDIDDPEVLDLKKQVEEKQGQILGEYKKDTQLFVDMGLLSDGFEGNDIVLSQDYVYILDEKSKRIIRVSTSSKRVEVVAGPSKINEATGLTAYLDNIYIITTKGIEDVTESDTKKVIDNTWEGQVISGSYAANIYLLEKNTSKIWRYSGNGEVFGMGKEWLSDSTSVNLTQAKAMAIDGNIWVLTSDGVVYKLSLGNLQTFTLDKNFAGGSLFDDLFTGDGVDNLYFLDRKNSRILVFDKEGKYKAQYINDAISATTQIVVSEKEGKIILLNGNKLFSIDLVN